MNGGGKIEMESKRGAAELDYIVWIIILLVFLFAAGMLYFVLKGEGAGLLDKFFNLF